MKRNKNKMVITSALMLSLIAPTAASAYTIDTTYQLSLSEGDNRRAANKFIVLHEVGTESSALNNAIYMKRAWSSNGAYTQFIVGDGGRVYKVGEDGYVSWGAGSYVNANAPVQIELARTFDTNQFKQDYAAYVNLARDYAIKYGIPLTLDSGGMYENGIKTHLWVTQNVWGDHTDPYGYLARFGITKAQLAVDLQNGISGNSSVIPPTNNNGNTAVSGTQVNQFWVYWNVADFKQVQNYRVNMNKLMKVDYSDIYYNQNADGTWSIGITNLDMNGLQNYRLQLMQRYNLNGNQINGQEFFVDSYLIGYKDITLQQLQNLRLRWIKEGYAENRLVMTQNQSGSWNLYTNQNSFRAVQHRRIMLDRLNGDINISDKRHYELER